MKVVKEGMRVFRKKPGKQKNKGLDNDKGRRDIEAEQKCRDKVKCPRKCKTKYQIFPKLI